MIQRSIEQVHKQKRWRCIKQCSTDLIYEKQMNKSMSNELSIESKSKYEPKKCVSKEKIFQKYRKRMNSLSLQINHNQSNKDFLQGRRKQQKNRCENAKQMKKYPKQIKTYRNDRSSIVDNLFIDGNNKNENRISKEESINRNNYLIKSINPSRFTLLYQIYENRFIDIGIQVQNFYQGNILENKKSTIYNLDNRLQMFQKNHEMISKLQKQYQDFKVMVVEQLKRQQNYIQEVIQQIFKKLTDNDRKQKNNQIQINIAILEDMQNKQIKQTKQTKISKSIIKSLEQVNKQLELIVDSLKTKTINVDEQDKSQLVLGQISKYLKQIKYNIYQTKFKSQNQGQKNSIIFSRQENFQQENHNTMNIQQQYLALSPSRKKSNQKNSFVMLKKLGNNRLNDLEKIYGDMKKLKTEIEEIKSIAEKNK